MSTSYTVSKDRPVFNPEKERYYIYWALAYPFTHKAILTRPSKRLEPVLGHVISYWQLLCATSYPGSDRDQFFAFAYGAILVKLDQTEVLGGAHNDSQGRS